jgi:TetR/AcrR family transcriptional regulator
MASKILSPRERILKCALREFSKYGYSGGRVARITRAAKVNERMLFYYFKSKEKLFTSVLESIWKGGHLVEEAPPTPVQSVTFWSQLYRNNPEWARMALWEGLERKKTEFDDEADRRKFWKISLEKMSSFRGPGGWPDFLDVPHLLLSLLAMELAPLSLPHFARLITGKNPSSPEFIEERDAFLKDFAYFIAQRKIPAREKTGAAVERAIRPRRNGHPASKPAPAVPSESASDRLL